MLKFILLFFALILIINYFEVFLVILIILSIIGGIVWYNDYKATERYLLWIDKRGVIPSSDISESMRKKLSDSDRTILLSSGHIMSAVFYEKLLNTVNRQNFTTQSKLPKLCTKCAVYFKPQNCSLVSCYAVKQKNWVCYDSEVTGEKYYLSANLLNSYTNCFEKEGALTQYEFVSKVLSAVKTEIPIEEYIPLSQVLLKHLCDKGKAKTIPLQPNSTMKETTLYCAVNRPENCRMTTNRISLD